MINLLPIENKVLVKKEYLKHLVAMFGLFSLAVVAVAILLLIFLLFLADKEKKDYGEYFALEQKHLSSENKEDIILFVSDVNSKVKIFEENQKMEKKAGEIIKTIIETKTKGISINYFSLNGDNVSLSGTARTRNELLSFVENLKKEPIFKKVDSPISNFLKENDVKFNISINL